MVKVLNIISDLNIGGAGHVLLNYLKYYDKSAFDISVCLPEGSMLAGPLKEMGAAVYELAISGDKSFDLKDIRKIKRLIKRTGPDIVHTHGSLSGRIAGRQCGKIVIYTRHSVFPVSPRIKSGPGQLINKIVNEHYADRIIAVSPAAKENLTDGGIRDSLIDIVMNGVEPLIRRDDNKRRQCLAQYGIEPGCFVLGIVARIEEYKGHMILLEALKILKDEGWCVKLLIAGTGTYEEAVRKKAAELCLTDDAVFLGFVSDVTSVLSILNVQINASYGTEATSLSLLEGMSLGLPAIVSDYGGNPYLIEDGITGLVFKSRDSGSLAQCIKRLADDPVLWKSMSCNAAETFSKRFTAQIFAENIEKIYIKALKGYTDGKQTK
jgi:glycosyltransferase involved in cell wall biosynthesis